MEAVEVEEVTRVFEPRRRDSTRVVALDSVSLTIPTGEIHGLLGPNGGSRNSSNAEEPLLRGSSGLAAREQALAAVRRYHPPLHAASSAPTRPSRP